MSINGYSSNKIWIYGYNNEFMLVWIILLYYTR